MQKIYKVGDTITFRKEKQISYEDGTDIIEGVIIKVFFNRNMMSHHYMIEGRDYWVNENEIINENQ